MFYLLGQVHLACNTIYATQWNVTNSLCKFFLTIFQLNDLGSILNGIWYWFHWYEVVPVWCSSTHSRTGLFNCHLYLSIVFLTYNVVSHISFTNTGQTRINPTWSLTKTSNRLFMLRTTEFMNDSDSVYSEYDIEQVLLSQPWIGKIASK